MRVLITTPSLELPGGVANYYRTLRSHLDQDKVYIEVGSRPGENGIWATMRRLIADSWRLHRTLRNGHWDLVHLNPSLLPRAVVRDGLLLLIARAHRQRVLVFFRGWDVNFAERIRRRHAGLFRMVYGRASAYVVLSEQFRDVLAALGCASPAYLATTVVDDRYLASPASGTAEERPGCHVLYLSRIDVGKGVMEALQAFNLARAEHPEMMLSIAGDGPERRTAEVFAHGQGIEAVRFLGHVDGAAKLELLRQADIFFFPTFYAEGMPNAVLEAMACGLPVVTRSVGGLRDFFEDGRMGFITDSREPPTFARLLLRLAADPGLRTRIGRYNRDYARRRFAASVVASRLLEIYGRVARETAAG